ncbi:hypothetical protein WICPIJ_004606 [Wickerhamomyces pijperi]|uniref:Uncharacterized protein n=1 Tax=Wickerhamomyces pijperi TaxID=599730 RepID=A0A9P8Q7A7_WICPI|nr:hypothetical protein WICPIJ_004606 [Wickerhamomyces pijperi]
MVSLYEARAQHKQRSSCIEQTAICVFPSQRFTFVQFQRNGLIFKKNRQCCKRPINSPREIRQESQQPNSDDVIAGDTIISIRQINSVQRIGSPKCKEGKDNNCSPNTEEQHSNVDQGLISVLQVQLVDSVSDELDTLLRDPVSLCNTAQQFISDRDDGKEERSTEANQRMCQFCDPTRVQTERIYRHCHHDKYPFDVNVQGIVDVEKINKSVTDELLSHSVPTSNES